MAALLTARPGRYLFLAALLIGLAVLAGACTTSTEEIPQAPPREVRIINQVSLADDDRTLRLRYWGTECEEFSDAELTYGITRVVIVVYALVSTEECERAGRQHEASVLLAEPLAGRILIDGNTDEIVLE